MDINKIIDTGFKMRYPFFQCAEIWHEVPAKWRAMFGKEFLEGMREIYLKMPKEEQEQFFVLQAKEKYGELRVYCSIYNKEIEDFIDIYRAFSQEYPLNV